LQPWKFIVVTDPGLRAKLTPASYGQAQIKDASHLVVFEAKNNFNEADVDAHIKHVAEVQGAPIAALAPLRNMLVGGIVQAMDEIARNAWARNQAYIALGNLLTSAALLGIDACPMEGFDRAQYDGILGLKAKGLATAVIATLGYRLATDKICNRAQGEFPEGTSLHPDLNSMKRTLQLLAVLVLLAAGTTWLATGANCGWTKTSLAVKTLDTVTGIEGISYEKKFLPGVDFLGAAALVAGLLAGTSLFFRHKNKTQTKN
jgi:nitroreductase